MKSKDEELFVSRIRDALDSEVLDTGITERLANARRNALNELEVVESSSSNKHQGHQNWSWFAWVPAGAMAIAVFAIALSFSSPKIPEFPYYESELQAATAADLELLEDLEFVAWMLAEEPGAA